MPRAKLEYFGVLKFAIRISCIMSELGAIHQGSRTQEEILRAISSRLQANPRSRVFDSEMDQLGDSLAILLNHPKRITTQVMDDVRQYFPAEEFCRQLRLVDRLRFRHSAASSRRSFAAVPLNSEA